MRIEYYDADTHDLVRRDAYSQALVNALRERDEARAEKEKAEFSARQFCVEHIGKQFLACPACELSEVRHIVTETLPDLADQPDRETTVRRVAALATRYQYQRDAAALLRKDVDAWRGAVQAILRAIMRTEPTRDATLEDLPKLVEYASGRAFRIVELESTIECVKASEAVAAKERDALKAEVERLRAFFRTVNDEIPEGLWPAKSTLDAFRKLVDGYKNVCKDAKDLRERTEELDRLCADAEHRHALAEREVERLRGELDYRNEAPDAAVLRAEGTTLAKMTRDAVGDEPDAHALAVYGYVSKVDQFLTRLRAAPPIVTTATHVQIPRADYERVAHLLDGATPPAVCAVDVEAAVEEWGDWKDALTAVLRNHTRAVSVESVAQAIMDAWQGRPGFDVRFMREGEKRREQVFEMARAALRAIGARLAEPEQGMTSEEAARVFSPERVAKAREQLARGDWVTPDALAEPDPAAPPPPTAQSIDLATIVPSNGHTDPDALIAQPAPRPPRGEWTEEQREAAWDMHLRTRGYTIDCNAARDHICLALAHVAPLFAPEPAPRPPFVVDRGRFNGIANRAGLAVARAIDECIAEIERQRAEWAGGTK